MHGGNLDHAAMLPRLEVRNDTFGAMKIFMEFIIIIVIIARAKLGKLCRIKTCIWSVLVLSIKF